MIAECSLCGCEERIEAFVRHPSGANVSICTHCIDQLVALRMEDEADEFTMQDAKDTAQAVSRFYDLRLS